jgi:glycosyltransferase involved in cell wall biosynthesis
MNILAIPIGPITTGSSRVRLYDLLRALSLVKGEEVHYDIVDPYVFDVPDPRMWSKYDVIYIQKVAAPHVVEFLSQVIIHATKNIKIVYDIDDDIGSSPTPGQYEETVCMLSDLILVDSPRRLKDMQEQFPNKNFKLLRGMIDFTKDPARKQQYDLSRPVQRATTFGFSDINIDSSLSHLKATGELGIKTEIIINHIPGREKYSKLCDTYTNWSLSQFISDLRRADMCVLCHSRDELGNRKGNHRLALAMSLGIPTITSKTEAFQKTLEEVGWPQLACETPEEIKAAVELIKNPLTRREISDIFLEYANNNHSPQQCAEEFYKLILEEQND